jgi:hypothetical protein
LRIVGATFLPFLRAHGVGVSVLRGFAAVCCGCTRVAFGALATFCTALVVALTTTVTTFATLGALATGWTVLLRCSGVLRVF